MLFPLLSFCSHIFVISILFLIITSIMLLLYSLQIALSEFFAVFRLEKLSWHSTTSYWLLVKRRPKLDRLFRKNLFNSLNESPLLVGSFDWISLYGHSRLKCQISGFLTVYTYTRSLRLVTFIHCSQVSVRVRDKADHSVMSIESLLKHFAEETAAFH